MCYRSIQQTSVISGDDLMNISKKLQGQIKRKEKEIQRFEAERQELGMKIREAHAAIKALEEVKKHLPKDEVDENPALSLQRGKSIAKIYDILKQTGSPMHIKDILAALGKDTDKKSQQATGSQLNSYVRNERIFTRDTPNTFGLQEWGNTNDPSPLSDTAESAQAGLPLAE